LNCGTSILLFSAIIFLDRWISKRRTGTSRGGIPWGRDRLTSQPVTGRELRLE